MSPLICKHAYREGGKKRGKVYCKVSGIVCAHVKWCELNGEFQQLASAADCPGKDMKDGEARVEAGTLGAEPL